MKKLLRLFKNEKGFTLIELIVVIAVLGMIAAIAIPKIGDVTSRAKASSNKQTITILNEAVERYVAETGDSDLSGFDGNDDKTLTVDEVVTGLKDTYTDGNNNTLGPYLNDDASKKLPSGDDAKWDAANTKFTE